MSEKVKDPNSFWCRVKRWFENRWWKSDHGQTEADFQVRKCIQDIGIALMAPAIFLAGFRTANAYFFDDSKKRAPLEERRSSGLSDGPHSQIIEFGKRGGGTGAHPGQRAPGALVKVRLLNVVETYSTAPVHAQVLDEGLGRAYLGGTLIGDATSDGTFDRINIQFRYVRDPARAGVAYSISARALGLDGTLGLIAKKKEGFFARSALGSAQESSQDMGSKGSDSDFKQILFRALTAGLVKEFGSESRVANNRAQVLSLAPQTVFYVELTDFFPRSVK